MSAGEESSGMGKVIWVIVLCMIGVLILVGVFLPNSIKTQFLSINEGILNFFSSSGFLAVRTIAGTLIVLLTGLITWLFFRLLEMEKEHEDHVYHHTDHAGHDEEIHHDEQHHQPHDNTPAHLEEHLTEPLYDVTKSPSQQAADIFKDDTPVQPRPVKQQVEQVQRIKTAPPPMRLPGESGVRGVQAGSERPGHVQWQSVLRLATSPNPSDWKLAIIEADVILDMMTYMQGIPGETLGERLKNADPGLFKTRDYARKAHYTRNLIAHEPDTQFTPREVQQAIRLYEEVFKEFRYI